MLATLTANQAPMGKLDFQFQENSPFHLKEKRLIQTLTDTIASSKGELNTISKEMYENPEVAWEEFRACKLLTDFMKSKGFKVEVGLANIPTAWSAEFIQGNGGCTIGFNSESRCYSVAL